MPSENKNSLKYIEFVFSIYFIITFLLLQTNKYLFICNRGNIEGPKSCGAIKKIKQKAAWLLIWFLGKIKLFFVFQNTAKDLLEAFLAFWRLINKRTLYYDTLARVTWPSEARWIAVYQGQHNTPLLLSLLRSSITQAGKSIEMNQNMAACLLFLAILGVFSVISQNVENCQVWLMAHKYKNRTIIYIYICT